MCQSFAVLLPGRSVGVMGDSHRHFGLDRITFYPELTNGYQAEFGRCNLPNMNLAWVMKRAKLASGFCFTLIFLTGCSSPWSRQTIEGFHSAAEGTFRYGPVSGFAQTPAGGNPGTSSRNRPTFSELDIHDSINAEASLEASWREHGIYGGGNFIRLDGKSELDESLVSRGTTFPAGDQVRSDVQLDWY